MHEDRFPDWRDRYDEPEPGSIKENFRIGRWQFDAGLRNREMPQYLNIGPLFDNSVAGEIAKLRRKYPLPRITANEGWQ